MIENVCIWFVRMVQPATRNVMDARKVEMDYRDRLDGWACLMKNHDRLGSTGTPIQRTILISGLQSTIKVNLTLLSCASRYTTSEPFIQGSL